MKSLENSYRIVGLTIKNLFGDKNYNFNLNKNPRVTILYGLNGTGKTTILRFIKNILNFNFRSIEKVVFDSFKFKLENQCSIMYVKGENEESKIIYTSKDNSSNDYWEPFSKLDISYGLEELRPNQMDLINFYAYLRGSNLITEFADIYKLPEKVGKYKFYDRIFKSRLGKLEYVPPNELFDILKPYLKDNILPFPIWFFKFTGDNSIRLIESERLITFKRDKKKEKNYKERVINDYSRHLLLLKRDLIEDFNKISQIQNSTFPKRVINTLKKKSIKTSPNSKDLKELMDLIREEERNLTSKGLLIKGNKEEPPIDKDSLEEGEIAGVISLWIKDSNEKYSIFDDLLDSIIIFEEILNESHLIDKIIKFDGKGGFYFYSSKTKQRLNGDKLSSGEQHAVVLFYFLIFLAEENSIVLIDEPEISFHVIWQNNFIDHIIRIGRKKGLTFILATHSPEIIYGRLSLVRKLEFN